MKHTKTLWIVRTAIFIALLLVLQAITKPMGQLVTGSAVNFVLIAAVVLGGLYSGLTVAALSPFFAFAVGIGPTIPQLLPAVAIGNMVLILVWHFVPKSIGKEHLVPSFISAALVGAVLKFAALYLGIVKLVLPVFLTNLPEKQVAALSATFSTPQLITALIGGGLCVIALPLLKKAIKD